MRNSDSFKSNRLIKVASVASYFTNRLLLCLQLNSFVSLVTDRYLVRRIGSLLELSFWFLFCDSLIELLRFAVVDNLFLDTECFR